MAVEAAADTDGFVFVPVRGPKRRIHFEPMSEGKYRRVESVWTGCEWREVGSEVCLSMRRV